MNDEELMTTVRESFTAVRSDTPVERIVSRSRAVRGRRRIPGAAGLLAVTAGVAVAVVTLVPAGQATGHAAGQRAGAQLAAWTVVKQADGSVAVTIRELHDPAALQSRLRADGVPASVISGGQPNPCQRYPRGGGTPLLSRMVTAKPGTNYNVFFIHPAAIPKGAGVQFAASFKSQHGRGGSGVTVDPVTASQQCTGTGSGSGSGSG
jgi:hypothetical protein